MGVAFLFAALACPRASTPGPAGQMTNPRLTGEPAGSFSFLVYGDIQESYRDGHRRLVERMITEDADLVFNTGDISRDRGRGYVEDFLPDAAPLIRRLPFFPAPGNHDIDFGSPRSRAPFQEFFRSVLDHAGRDWDNPQLLEPGAQKLWYRIVYGDVLFVVLDSNLFIDEGKYRETHNLPPYAGYRGEQLEWVREVLERSARDPRIRARFVFFHHSPVASEESGGFLGIGGHPGHRRLMLEQAFPDTGGYLLDLFRTHDVTAVFSGHEHYYERWREVIEESGARVRSLNWIVTGLGGVRPRGKPEYDNDEIAKLLESGIYRNYLRRAPELNPNWTARLEHLYPNAEDRTADFTHYVKVAVSAGGVRFETIDVNGAVRDSGSFTDFRAGFQGNNSSAR